MKPSASKIKSPSAKPCGLGRRLLVMLYDGVVVAALLLLATALALLAGWGNVRAGRDPLFTAYLLLTWFAYLAWCWTQGGMTLGMRVWGVRIERENGDAPGWGDSALRFAVSLVSAASVGAGFGWSLFESRRRTWHDLASGTRLLRR